MLQISPVVNSEESPNPQLHNILLPAGILLYCIVLYYSFYYISL